MIDVKDRVPTKPGRVKITKEDGSVEYVIIERADEPVEEGTPINKVLFDSIKDEIIDGNSYLTPVINKVENGSTIKDVEPVVASADDTYGVYEALPDGSVPDVTVSGSSAYFNDITLLNWLKKTGFTTDSEAVVRDDSYIQFDFKKIFEISFYINTYGTSYIGLTYSSDGVTWNKFSYTNSSTTSFNLNTLTARYIRLVDGTNSSNSYNYIYTFYVKNLKVPTTIYRNKFTIDKIKLNQNIKLAMPDDMDILNVEDNTLNDVPIENILQPGMKYDLLFDGEKLINFLGYYFRDFVRGEISANRYVTLDDIPKLVIGFSANSSGIVGSTSNYEVQNKNIINTSSSDRLNYIAYF